MDEFYFKGRYSLFSACRLSDGKMGQVATFEDASDVAIFNTKFVPD
jgi:hypothetical protein